jgi:hypothetical protein
MLIALKNNDPINQTVNSDIKRTFQARIQKSELPPQKSKNDYIPGYLRRLSGKFNTDQRHHELFYDGRNLSMVISDVDNQNIEVIEVEGTSGKPGVTNPSMKNLGPLPEGVYYFNTQDITFNPLRRIDVSYLPFFDEVNGEWGSYRVPLTPAKETNTFGREGFFIHGGKRAGSAGCIDLGQKDNIVLDSLMGYNKKVKLTVKYRR